jgi:adenylate kinase
MRVVLLGPPGAGKGTQAAAIAAAYRIPHIATGDIFRDNARERTVLGLAAEEYMNRGELVPDGIVIGMVKDRLDLEDAREGFLLDGFPRTVPQALELERVLAEAARPLHAVLRFAIPADLVIHRIANRRSCPDCGAVYQLDSASSLVEGVCDHCGGTLIQREDDDEHVVRRRLEEYEEKTAPLEEFYAQRGLLRDLDAVGAIEEVTARALALLGASVTGPLPEGSGVRQ